ncbi:cyclic di-GMP phosphodiesterase response regulator RpfG [Clostridium saccharobutylicum]|uniref:HD domain-containing phosphohydrolase n=1 Tax=Clostridium saccharobutylicum TaxID=169679 RepID=UPI000983C0E1|nr:HD domain-containing phosphohydrolase [Clostridium saccharobutylicum]AQS09501.1 cyclic di-GMP phosphodiesterase response regulator RpfG [Clostridium saccharobutylicum]MBC2436249.1 HD domain-containing protein [Clostridium saccharobutylicum]NSB87935.1 putative nucleotidyltransferase with HDIG domain [Clostridium saccharobutylicum]NYC28123.1 putative nucleotidyltransferase with HDIG domain [Clostridium saccharobutylicum]OOM15122.1 cyclic di-GMP phosphodiesterase response regulator RpfG [Clost
MNNNLGVTSNKMISIIHKDINAVDKRLLNHGQRVAYIMLNLLKADGSYSEEEILKICFVSILHDIGAYKVTERDKLTAVDIITPFNHAIYGALFIKYFSPLGDLYKIVLTHHFTVKYYKDRHMEIVSKEGLLLNFADYLDRIYLNKQVIEKLHEEKQKKHYLKEHINLFIEADKKYQFIEKLIDGTYITELDRFFEKRYFTREKVVAYSKMLAYCIDFRSEATVIHTITVEAISEQIAKIYGLDDEKVELIKVAATLHDIGKIAIPVEILEKPGKLTQEEFEIMKSHAKIGYDILSGVNIDDIRDIGTLHHEKLDGNGYPFGLKAEQISVEMRIVAISDIVSALVGVRSYKEGFNKEKIIKILKEMSDNNKIDSTITHLFIQNYDYIVDEAKKQCADLMDKYLNIQNEYKETLKYFS